MVNVFDNPSGGRTARGSRLLKPRQRFKIQHINDVKLRVDLQLPREADTDQPNQRPKLK